MIILCLANPHKRIIPLYCAIKHNILLKENIMWTTPAATEMRFGFEVTMYVMNK
jgi:pyrroloquinoline quinone biosynthesis protein A